MSDKTTSATEGPMADEIEAHAELVRLGRAALDNADDGDGGEAHDAFRAALADWNDDTLWRLLMRVRL